MSYYTYIPPDQVYLIWEDVSEGISQCIEKGGLGIHTLELVQRNLVLGTWSLWIGAHQGRRVGFYILNTLVGSHIELAYGYLDPNFGNGREEFIQDGLKQIEEYAKAFKCKKVIAYSTRIGMSKLLAKKHGYTGEMTIYCKELVSNETPEEDSCD